MTKTKIKELIKEAWEDVSLVNAYFRFDTTYYNLIPLKFGDKLFLAVNEDDFIFDGYSIFRFKDLTKVKIKDDICNTILKKEGLISKMSIPDIDLSNWRTVFESLKQMDRNIIIEKRTLDETNAQFVIGRIEKSYKSFAYVWHFDADGIWLDSPIRVPYSEITNITLGSRYAEVFSKYISEPPFVTKC